MENKNKSFLPLAFALLAVALGGAALYLSINSVEKQKESEVMLSEKSDKAFATAVESKTAVEVANKANAEIAKLKQEIESLKLAIKQNTEATNKNIKGGFEYYSKSITDNRNLIIANQEGIKTLAERISPTKAEPKEDLLSEIPISDEGEYIVYVIKSGDYFSKLAKQFKVSVEAIEAANPNVLSTALRIGQKINIPKAK